MRRWYYGFLFIGVGIWLFSLGGLSACAKLYPPPATQEKEKVTEAVKPTPSPATITVKIAGLLFDPATVNIAAGTTVTWTNNDSVSHTVTAKEALFDSGNLSRGATFSSTFSQNGTFEYYCKIHPSMKGKVVVGDTSTSQTEQPSGQSPDY